MVDQVKGTAGNHPKVPVPSSPPAGKGLQAQPTSSPPAVAGDRAQVSPAAQAANRAGDVDIEVNFGQAGTTLHGRVTLTQQEVQQMLTDAFNRSSDLYNVKFTYDASGGSYKVSGKYNLDWLPDPSMSFTVKPEVHNGAFRLRVSNIDTPGPQFEKIDKWVVYAIGKELKAQGLVKQVDAGQRYIELDNQAIVRRSAEPTLGAIDWASQDVSPAIDPQGNMTITFTVRGRPAPGPDADPAHTDVRVNMDAAHILQELNRRFGNKDVSFKDVTLKDNSMRVTADVTYMGGTSAVMGFLGIFAVAAALGGDPRGLQAGGELLDAADKGKAHKTVSLDVQIDSRRLTVTTGDDKTLDGIAEHFKKLGIASHREGNRIIVDDFRKAVPEFKDVREFRITPQGVSIEGRR